MKKYLLFLTVAFSSTAIGQTVPAYQENVALVSAANINSYLLEFENLGVKTTGSAANVNTLNWLKTKYATFGYTAADMVEHSWTYGGYTSKNLIVTKNGTGTNASKFIIICGHFDTLNGRGVNDNGSGVSLILEVARILKAVPTDYSLKFINFSGEEQGLLGSKAYVDHALAPGKENTYFVLNIDEIGGVINKPNTTVTCESDQTSTGGTENNAPSLAITTQLSNHIKNYTDLQTVFDRAYSSDYMPFEQKGYVITGLFETNETTHKHTSTDIKNNMDPAYVTRITKGVVGAIQHFAGASTTSTLNAAQAKNSGLVILYPNPASGFVTIGVDEKKFEVTVSDMSGKTVLEVADSHTVDIRSLQTGQYLLTVTAAGKKITRTLAVRN